MKFQAVAWYTIEGEARAFLDGLDYANDSAIVAAEVRPSKTGWAVFIQDEDEDEDEGEGDEEEHR